MITAKAADGSEVTGTLEITVTEKPVAVTEITITGQNVMTVGDSQILKLDIQPETAASQEVTWSSDHPEILAVTQKGKAEAKTPGTATITAEAEDGSGVKGTIQITVEEAIVEAESLTITGVEGDTLHLTEAGQTVQLGAEILPENTTDKTITWETDQPEVITIDETGLVTAKTNGTAKITAKTTNGIKAELTVTVDVTNTGGREGKESVLLYSSDLVASSTPDNIRLRDFEKISLKPGETKTVTFKLKANDLAFVGYDGKWRLEKGDFKLSCGNQQTTITCTQTKVWDTPNR